MLVAGSGIGGRGQTFVAGVVRRQTMRGGRLNAANRTRHPCARAGRKPQRRGTAATVSRLTWPALLPTQQTAPNDTQKRRRQET